MQSLELISDTGFSDVISKALKQSKYTDFKIIDIIDEQDSSSASATPIGQYTYEQLIELGDGKFNWQLPDDEWDAICLNYTSGTGGRLKVLFTIIVVLI